MFPPTIIIRHRKENLKKCSLKGLEKRSDCIFLRYPLQQVPACNNYILLSLEAPKELSIEDADCGLLLLDATWRYAQTMEKQLVFSPAIRKRCLPKNLLTAYPRCQQGCSDPLRGLASIEALVCAYALLGRSLEGLLDHYYWRESFLEKNDQFMHNCRHANNK